jgi:carboxyl-terminal processing protease
VPTPSELQLEVFEKVWHIVLQTYLYPDFNGADWEALGEQVRQRIKDGLTNEDFYQAMEAMIDSLGDDHSVFLRPQEATEEDAEFSGQNDYVGIGVLTRVVEERQRAVILVVFPGSPAEKAGLKPHDSILAVGGEPLVDEDGYHRSLLLGAEGTSIELTVQTPGEQPRQISISRRRVTGSVPVPYSELLTAGGKRVGYILLVTLADDTIDDQVEFALNELTSSGPLDGLILDNRENSGGADHVARAVLGYFVHGTLGHFYDRDKSRRAFNVIGTDINGSSKVPLVVLVGPGTVSFGEITSGVLQDARRATIIGEATGGNIELLWGYDFEDGSRAWIAHETFRPSQNPDMDWEQTGIIPDITALSNWDEVTPDDDPAIQAALEYLDGLE